MTTTSRSKTQEISLEAAALQQAVRVLQNGVATDFEPAHATVRIIAEEKCATLITHNGIMSVWVNVPYESKAEVKQDVRIPFPLFATAVRNVPKESVSIQFPEASNSIKMSSGRMRVEFPVRNGLGVEYIGIEEPVELLTAEYAALNLWLKSAGWIVPQNAGRVAFTCPHLIHRKGKLEVAATNGISIVAVDTHMDTETSDMGIPTSFVTAMTRLGVTPETPVQLLTNTTRTKLAVSVPNLFELCTSVINDPLPDITPFVEPQGAPTKVMFDREELTASISRMHAVGNSGFHQMAGVEVVCNDGEAVLTAFGTPLELVDEIGCRVLGEEEVAINLNCGLLNSALKQFNGDVITMTVVDSGALSKPIMFTGDVNDIVFTVMPIRRFN